MKHINIILVIALITLMAACSMPNDLPQQQDTAGLAQVRVNINTNARTIFPNFDWIFSKYELSAEPAEGNTQSAPSSVEFSGNENWGVINVPLGNWIFTVIAYVNVNGTDYAAAKGSVPLNVVDSFHWVYIYVNMPEPGGTGTFAYNVAYPAGGSAQVKLEPWPLDSGPALVNASPASGVEGSEDVPSGVYFLTVTASANGITKTRNEIVHVYQQLSTNANYTFTKLDFGATSLQIGGTIKVLVDGQQPGNAMLGYSIGGSGHGFGIYFSGSDGTATWNLVLSDLRGADTLSFWVEVMDDFFVKELDTIPVPTDDTPNIDLGIVSFVTIPLEHGVWTEGNVPIGVSQTTDLYRINVQAGTTYYFWMNNAYEGDGTKTANTFIQARYSNGYYIGIGQNDAWYFPASFEAYMDGTVYVRINAYGNWDTTDTYAIAYSTNNTFNNPIATVAIPLDIDTWEDGNVPAGKNHTVDWYKIEVTEGARYYFWLNNRDYGDGTKTAEAYIALYGNGKYIFTSTNNAWDQPQSFYANISGTVYLRVDAYSDYSNRNDTYAVAYSTNRNWRIDALSIPLDPNVWKAGYVPAGKENVVDWYKIEVTAGETYYIWMNHSDEGDGSKTAWAYLIGQDSYGNYLFGTWNVWFVPQAFTAETSGTIYLQVNAGGDKNSTNTYAIAYSTDRDWHNIIDEVVIPLDAEIWKEGNVPIGKYNTTDLYSIEVNAGTRYYIWMNNAYEGNNSKTAYTNMSALYSNGTYVVYGTNTAWYNPVSFIAETNGTVYVRVSAWGNENTTRTYAIAYSTDGNWYNAIAGIATPLTADIWKEGNVPAGKDNTTDWYSVQVEAGKTYYFWMNNRGYGDGTKTAGSWMELVNDGEFVFGTDNAWYFPRSFTAETSGTVYVRVNAWSDYQNTTDTYAIAYSTNSNKFGVGAIAVPLTVNTWKDGSVPVGESYAEHWYSVEVSAGTSYYFWANNANGGDGTKTAYTYVTGYFNGELYFNYWSAWDWPAQCYAYTDGTIYLKVEAEGDWYTTNTYAIAYSTNENWNRKVDIGITISTAFETNSRLSISYWNGVTKGDDLYASIYYSGSSAHSLSYAWFIDSVLQEGYAESEVYLPTEELSLGIHYGLVVVTIDGAAFTKEFAFRVYEK
jgi:hypothetical protein